MFARLFQPVENTFGRVNEGCYMHSLHHPEHGLFLNLKTLKAYILPDNTELKGRRRQCCGIGWHSFRSQTHFHSRTSQWNRCKADSLNDYMVVLYPDLSVWTNQKLMTTHANVVLQKTFYTLTPSLLNSWHSLTSFQQVPRKIWIQLVQGSNGILTEFLNLSTVSARNSPWLSKLIPWIF